MDKINILFYKYPPEAKYSVFENDPDPTEISTDYGVETTKSFPCMGETRSHRRHEWVDGECKLIPTLWKVFDVKTSDRVSFVHLSLDGTPAELESTLGCLQVVVTPDQTKLSWPEPGYEAVVGDQINKDFKVNQISEFSAPVGNGLVRILWCAPISELAIA